MILQTEQVEQEPEKGLQLKKQHKQCKMKKI